MERGVGNVIITFFFAHHQEWLSIGRSVAYLNTSVEEGNQ